MEWHPSLSSDLYMHIHTNACNIYKCVHARKYVYMWNFGQRMWERVVMLKALLWMDIQEPQSTQSQTLNYPHWAFCVTQGRSSRTASPHSSAHACPCSPHSDVSRAMPPASCGDRGWVQQLLCPWIAHGLVEKWLKKNPPIQEYWILPNATIGKKIISPSL